MSNPTRDTFDPFWLQQSAEPAKSKGMRAVRLEEREGSRTKIQSSLLAAIYDHHIHPDRVAGTLSRLGFEKASAALLQQLPRADRTRKGNFGEVVASEHLRQSHGFKMPVFKLRYADNPQMPQRGEDIVAFETDTAGKITALCIGEAKVRATNGAPAVQEAHKRLSQAYHPYPVALSLISSILHERGDHALADQVDKLMETLAAGRFPRHNWIFVITQDESATTLTTLVDHPDLVDNLTCVHIHLADIGQFINTLFESPLPREGNADK